MWSQKGRSRRARSSGPLSCEHLENRALLAVFHPLSYVSDGAAQSLRQAVQTANTNNEDDTILLDTGVYDLTVENGVQENAAATGDLDLTEANHQLTLQGEGMGLTVIDAHQIDRLFQVFSNVTLVLSNLSIRNGKAQDDGSAGVLPGSTAESNGGGILAEAGSTITLANVAVEQSQAFGAPGVSSAGGGIYTTGTCTLSNSMIASNSAVAGGDPASGRNASGGGIFAADGAILFISGSTLASNQAIGGSASTGGAGGTAEGGGLLSLATVTFTNSRATSNRAIGGPGVDGGATGAGGFARGAGMALSGDVTLDNALIAGNEAAAGVGSAGSLDSGNIGGTGGMAQGGGVWVADFTMLQVTGSTFTLNRARGGPGGDGAHSNVNSLGGAGGAAGEAQGGALFVAGSATLADTTCDSNFAGGGRGGSGGTGLGIGQATGGAGGAGRGGGLAIAGATTVVSTTISGNIAQGGGGGFGSTFSGGPGDGGGIYLSRAVSTLNATSATIAKNQASALDSTSRGGGISNQGVVNVVSTIIGDNTAGFNGPDYLGAFNIADHVVLENSTDAAGISDGDNGNIVGQDPKLNPLADNGGPTQTQLPKFDSPAINVGINPMSLTTDQRGLARVSDGAIDIGAVERQAPAIATGGTVFYVENAAPLIVAPAAVVTSGDRADLQDGNLTVTISANANANDRVEIKNQGNGAGQIGVSGAIVSFAGAAIGTFTGGIGSTPLVVTFNTAAATSAAAQALARAITFRTITEAPSTSPRTVGFQLADGDNAASSVSTVTVNVTAVNDAPVLNTGVPVTLNPVAEDTANPAGTLVSALVGGVSDVDAGAVKGVAVSGVSNSGGAWQYTLNGTTWLNFGGPTRAAARLLAADASTRIRFRPDTNFNGSSTFFLFAWDQTQGAAGGTLNISSAGSIGGTTAFSSAVVQGSASVTPVNDAPVLNTGVPVALDPVAEDTADPAGTLVSSLVAGVNDIDAAAVKGIAVSTVNTFTGLWQYALDGVNWLNFGSVSRGAVRLLPADATARVRMIPNANFNGSSSLWFFAWDQTQGSTGGTANLNLAGTTGGTTAFSNAAIQASVSVTAVNDAPVLGLSGSVGYTLGSPAVVVAPAATVTDLDSANFDTGELVVHISTGASAANQLALSGFTIGPGFAVMQGATQIGTRTADGLNGNDLRITLNANATAAVVQQLVRSITFRATGTTGSRTLLFTVSDGDGGLSDVRTKTVGVS